MKLKNTILPLLSLLIMAACQQRKHVFEKIDEDASADISREEYLKDWYQAGYFNLWDRNNDNKISKEEWRMGLDEYYSEYAYTSATFDEWNLNGDEFINEKELATGSFTIYDTDGDGKIEKAEYEVYHQPDE